MREGSGEKSNELGSEFRARHRFTFQSAGDKVTHHFPVLISFFFSLFVQRQDGPAEEWSRQPTVHREGREERLRELHLRHEERANLGHRTHSKW